MLQERLARHSEYQATHAQECPDRTHEFLFQARLSESYSTCHLLTLLHFLIPIEITVIISS